MLKKLKFIIPLIISSFLVFSNPVTTLALDPCPACPVCETCTVCPPVQPPTDLDRINTSILLVPASMFTILFFYNIFIMYRNIKR